MRRILVLALTLMLTGTAWANTIQSGTITLNFDLSGQQTGKEARLWVPYPVSGDYQVISNVKYGGDFADAAVYTDRTFQTPMLFVRWTPAAKSRVLTFSFEVAREEIRQPDLAPTGATWDPADYSRYLQPTRLGPTDGAVGKLADRITAGRTTVLARARAVYDWVCENMYRDPGTRGCGAGDVCALLQRPGGKCADISSVFVALARAAGVPAREVFGIRQGKQGVTDITGWQHCWAEFYLPGRGWVTVDPGDVRKMMLKQDLALTDAETAEYRRYFWGGADPYRVRLGTGRDLTLAPAQQGPPVNYLMYPFAQVGGRTIDWLDAENFQYTITWRP